MSKVVTADKKTDKGNVEPLNAGSPKMPKLLYRLLIHASPTGKEKVISDIIKAAITGYNPKHVIVEDKMGNLSVEIGVRGKDHNTLFSCHMDTVHFKEEILSLGISKKNYEKGDGYVFAFTRGALGGWHPEILGADDKLGIYALLQLIKNNTPGLYIFHVGEEKGGIGSKWIAENKPDLVKDIKRAIAFDRRGTTDVIGEQRGSPCCSKDFGIALAARLNAFMPPKNKYTSGAIGTFTDTASYTKLIPECTNISCGYYNEHTSSEHFDLYWYLDSLLPAILKMNWETLPTVRDPTAVASRVTWTNNRSNFARWQLSLENIEACKSVFELKTKLDNWVSTVTVLDHEKQEQLLDFVDEVLTKLDLQKKTVTGQKFDKELLNSYIKIISDFVTHVSADLASDSENNKIEDDKISSMYSHFELISNFVKEYEDNEEDDSKPSIEEILVLCVDYMFICVTLAGNIKVKSSGTIDATTDLIKALSKIRAEKFLKGTVFRKNVKLPAMVTNGSYKAMPVPCVKKCGINEVYGLCTGCNRTKEEKQRWYGFPLEEQKNVWTNCSLRAIAFPEISSTINAAVN